MFATDQRRIGGRQSLRVLSAPSSSENYMNRYRLMVRKGARLLGHFESATPWARDAVQDISRCLAGAGYDLELLVADGERRLLDCAPDGIRLLASEPLFKRAELQPW